MCWHVKGKGMWSELRIEWMDRTLIRPLKQCIITIQRMVQDEDAESGSALACRLLPVSQKRQDLKQALNPPTPTLLPFIKHRAKHLNGEQTQEGQE
mmetsp:Transcript_10918/g.24108  ORF Transcript_10918/g.24108 Transcript_10918/m.24108 type:complete len:96 (-) Transcript_10918:134-421(-)